MRAPSRTEELCLVGLLIRDGDEGGWLAGWLAAAVVATLPESWPISPVKGSRQAGRQAVHRSGRQVTDSAALG